jgi:pimeloyl-ACP methyl ester carboxylesterase
MYLSFNGGRIHYNERGKGKPLILLHGYLETSGVWQNFAEKMAGSFRVLTVDLPGHGFSDSYGAIHTMEFMAAAIKELIDSTGLTKVFLTGHSLGGYVTLAFAELYPGLLSGYCLFNSQPFPDTPETIEKRKKEIDLVGQGNKEMFYPGNITRMYASSNLEKFSESVQRSKEIASKLSDEGIKAVLNGMIARPSRLSVMENGSVPFLWILGAMDNYIPCEAMRKRVNLPPGARLVVLAQSGHMGFIEEEDLSVKVLSDFIVSLR